MKVALMTIFQVPNYGSVLQAFATQTVLEKLGYECDVINYNYPNDWHYRHGFARPSALKLRVKNALGMLGIHFNKFKAGIENFRKSRLNLTRLYKDLDELTAEDWSGYGAMITGSDQVWNPRFLKGDSAFMLSFGKDVKRMSIASSFACDSLPSELIQKYKSFLGSYSAVSVREGSGLRILHDQLGLDCPSCVMLDPTLLLSADEWTSELKLREKSDCGKYVLLYILDYAFEPRPRILDIATKMKERYACDTIITFSEKDSPEVRELGAVSVEVRSVDEFVGYFKNATVVVTSSFHGTAFALNYSRPLISVCPQKSDERQQGLLNELGIPSNGVVAASPIESIDTLDADYDTFKVQTALSARRQKHFEWIKASIEA